MLRWALAAAFSLFPVLGFAQSPELVEAGKLTWGASVTFPPFEFQQNNQPAGFDVDLVAALAKQMQPESNIVSIEFKGLIPALQGKRIDIIVSGMYINPQRLEVADMIPYLLVGNQIVVPQGNPKHIDGTTSLCGLNVAAPIGTVFENSAKQTSAACKPAGKPEINLLSLAGTVQVRAGADPGTRRRNHRFHPDGCRADHRDAWHLRHRRRAIRHRHQGRYRPAQGQSSAEGRAGEGTEGRRRRRHLRIADQEVEPAGGQLGLLTA